MRICRRHLAIAKSNAGHAPLRFVSVGDVRRACIDRRRVLMLPPATKSIFSDFPCVGLRLSPAIRGCRHRPSASEIGHASVRPPTAGTHRRLGSPQGREPWQSPWRTCSRHRRCRKCQVGRALYRGDAAVCNPGVGLGLSLVQAVASCKWQRALTVRSKAGLQFHYDPYRLPPRLPPRLPRVRLSRRAQPGIAATILGNPLIDAREYSCTYRRSD